MERLQSAFGLLILLGLAWLFSEARRKIRYRPVVAGVLLQLALGLLFIRAPGSRTFFHQLNRLVTVLEDATRAGTSFVFGFLGGADLPFSELSPGASYVLACRGLPLLLLMSALTALLFHWGILQRVVGLFSFILRKTMGISGCESLGTSANIFVGMIEAPLFIRLYFSSLTRSELFTIMAGGMATIAGTMMVLYANILGGVLDGALGHLLVASVISAPAAITVAKLMIPETGTPREGDFNIRPESRSSMDAITRGTLQGLELLLNVVAMLVVFVALVFLVNAGLGLLPHWGGEAVSMERILGWLMAPLAWLMGVDWSEARVAGSLMGTKVVLNEMLAYIQLARLPEGVLSPRSRLIMLYAMCGFANFGSVGIMIGGMGAISPERRGEVVELGLRSIVAGTLATMMTGCVVGMLGIF
jgi:CNT family concentrative nucleoside transporter